MVVTRGQTGSDGPVTPTASTAAPVRHNPNTTIASEIGPAGRCGECAASTDLQLVQPMGPRLHRLRQLLDQRKWDPQCDQDPQGTRCQPVPLDAPDVALRGQRLLAYGERLRREEAETGNPGAGRARHPARPRRPTARQEWLETVERQMPAPPAVVGKDDVGMRGQTRPLRAKERIYVEPPGAPEIGRRPLDLNAGQHNVAQNGRVMMRPMHLRQEAPVYEDHYRAATAPRIPHRVGV